MESFPLWSNSEMIIRLGYWQGVVLEVFGRSRNTEAMTISFVTQEARNHLMTAEEWKRGQ
jgi:hypothetical protein